MKPSKLELGFKGSLLWALVILWLFLGSFCDMDSLWLLGGMGENLFKLVLEQAEAGSGSGQSVEAEESSTAYPLISIRAFG